MLFFLLLNLQFVINKPILTSAIAVVQPFSSFTSPSSLCSFLPVLHFSPYSSTPLPSHCISCWSLIRSLPWTNASLETLPIWKQCADCRCDEPPLGGSGVLQNLYSLKTNPHKNKTRQPKHVWQCKLGGFEERSETDFYLPHHGSKRSRNGSDGADGRQMEARGQKRGTLQRRRKGRIGGWIHQPPVRLDRVLDSKMDASECCPLSGRAAGSSFLCLLLPLYLDGPSTRSSEDAPVSHAPSNHTST